MTIAETCAYTVVQAIEQAVAEIDNFYTASANNVAGGGGLIDITSAEKSTLSTLLGHIDDMGASILGSDLYAKVVAVKAKLDA